jgi:hypothetical protein
VPSGDQAGWLTQQSASGVVVRTAGSVPSALMTQMAPSAESSKAIRSLSPDQVIVET